MMGVVVAMTALTGVVGGYIGQLDRNRGSSTGWIGVVALAGGFVYLALAHHHLEYLIMLAYFPLGYFALHLGSKLRDRIAPQPEDQSGKDGARS
jgi:hypothetical protein